MPTAPPQHDAEADEPDADETANPPNETPVNGSPPDACAGAAVCAGAVAEVPFAVVESDFTTTTAFGLYWSPAAVAGVVPAA